MTAVLGGPAFARNRFGSHRAHTAAADLSADLDLVAGHYALLRVPVENLGWTGSNNNFTGPRHYPDAMTTIQPGGETSTKSYYLEKIIGALRSSEDEDTEDSVADISAPFNLQHLAHVEADASSACGFRGLPACCMRHLMLSV